jgi:hypothetical protein
VSGSLNPDDLYQDTDATYLTYPSGVHKTAIYARSADRFGGLSITLLSGSASFYVEAGDTVWDPKPDFVGGPFTVSGDAVAQSLYIGTHYTETPASPQFITLPSSGEYKIVFPRPLAAKSLIVTHSGDAPYVISKMIPRRAVQSFDLEVNAIKAYHVSADLIETIVLEVSESIVIGPDLIGDKTIDGRKIIDGTVSGVLITPGTITANLIQAGSITANLLDVDQLSAVATKTGSLEVTDSIIVTSGQIDAGLVKMDQTGITVGSFTEELTDTNTVRILGKLNPSGGNVVGMAIYNSLNPTTPHAIFQTDFDNALEIENLAVSGVTNINIPQGGPDYAFQVWVADPIVPQFAVGDGYINLAGSFLIHEYGSSDSELASLFTNTYILHKGDIDVQGTVTAFTGIHSDGTITAVSDIATSGNLVAGANLTTEGEITANGNLTTYSSFSADGSITGYSNMFITDDAILYSGLYVSGVIESGNNIITTANVTAVNIESNQGQLAVRDIGGFARFQATQSALTLRNANDTIIFNASTSTGNTRVYGTFTSDGLITGSSGTESTFFRLPNSLTFFNSTQFNVGTVTYFLSDAEAVANSNFIVRDGSNYARIQLSPDNLYVRSSANAIRFSVATNTGDTRVYNDFRVDGNFTQFNFGSMTKNAAQTVNAGVTAKITFQVAGTNGVLDDLANNQINIIDAGLYLIVAGVVSTTVGLPWQVVSGGAFNSGVLLNSVTQTDGRAYSSKLLYLSPGELELWLSNTGGTNAAISIGNNGAILSVTKVG